MEANQENLAPESQAPETPSFEQEIMDTQEARNSSDTTFEQTMGLPVPEETRAPQLEDTTGPAPQPPVQQDFSQNELNPENNDQVRYQYWQSQAAKLQNQLNEVKEYQPMVDYLRANPEAVQSITPGGKAPAEAAPTSQEQEEFPPPPARPEQPAGFSREEAYSDPASTSAQYLDEVDKWRDDIQTYNQLASQYQVAVMRETYNKKIENLENIEKSRVQRAEEANKMNEVRSYVQNNYDLGEDLDDFISTMNDPNSVSMDELVAYYKFKKGMPPAPTQQSNVSAPSNTFNQVKRAQSVPTPMGVQPAQTNEPSDSSQDFMSALIKNDKQNNIL